MADTIEIIQGTATTVEVAGPTGPQGPAGSNGANGQGVPVGGTTGQVLRKASGTDYDTEWSSSGGGSVDLSSPDPIGDVTPNTGAFTTLSATGTATLPHIHGSLAGNLYLHVKNVSGGQLTRGTPVYIVGNVGDTDRVEVAAADFDDATKMPAVGLLEQTLANNGSGDAIILGELDEANTNAYTINQELFVGNNGTLTATRPTTGQVQSAGVVARVNSNTGVIVVNMQGQRSPNETFAAASHSHGNLTNSGAVGTTANLPLKTGTNGVVEAGSFGTSAGSFCEGNDARLSDARTPSSTLAHAASHAAGAKAYFAGQVGGMTTYVIIRAANDGTAGNSILLSFDGVDDIDTVLSDWNTANSSNTATIETGDGSQVPDNGESITLGGGINQGGDPIANPVFDTVGLGITPTGSARKFHQRGGKFTVESSFGGYGQFQIVNPDEGEISFVFAAGSSCNEDGSIATDNPDNEWAFGAGTYGFTPDRFTIGNKSYNSAFFFATPEGNIGIRQSDPTEALHVAGKVAIEDTDSNFKATFDAEAQLSGDVTLTIPDQSGTLAVVTDIPTTAGDVGAVAAGAITTSGLTQATARILGRTTASTGAVEEIQIGSGLSLSAGELSATGGSGVTAVGTTLADILSVSGSDLVADDLAADKLYGWDDSESKAIGFIIGSGLSVSGDTLSATASGGSKTYAVFTATDNQPPATAFATLDTRNSIAVLDFDDATDESAVFVSIMPEAASLGSGLKIRLHWMATTATSGNVVWDVSLERMTTDLDSDSFDTIANGTAAANGTSGILTVTEITLTTIDSVTAGDGFRLKVTRDANNASDTMTGDAELVVCEVRSAA
jgi:hypothetical protein